MCVTPVPLKMETLKWKARKYMLPQKSDIINVPCGKCYECRRSQVNQWVFRINNEFKAKTTERAYFITLTYNDEFLYNPENGLITEYGEMTLNYKHHQDFIKRLRKSYGNGKSNIKYFAVGEYGEKSDRPHFHTIIFNAEQQNILDAWKDNGNIHFGEVTEASITYTLKYAMKKIGRVHKKGWKDKNFHREIERALISRGIGLEYAENNNNKQYYGNDINRQVTSEGAKYNHFLATTNKNFIRKVNYLLGLKILSEPWIKTPLSKASPTVKRLRLETIRERRKTEKPKGLKH